MRQLWPASDKHLREFWVGVDDAMRAAKALGEADFAETEEAETGESAGIDRLAAKIRGFPALVRSLSEESHARARETRTGTR
jgi:hypothetical protein